MSGGVPVGELLPCPVCGAEPKRNGRGRTGGVVCRGPGYGVGKIHLVQAYGADQSEADTAWNTRATPTPPIEGRDADVERVARALAEYQIRQARRWDTDADVLEAMMPVAIEHTWPSLMPQARAALQALGERG